MVSFLYSNCNNVSIPSGNRSIIIGCTENLAGRRVKGPTLLVVEEAPLIYLITTICLVTVVLWIYLIIMIAQQQSRHESRNKISQCVAVTAPDNFSLLELRPSDAWTVAWSLYSFQVHWIIFCSIPNNFVADLPSILVSASRFSRSRFHYNRPKCAHHPEYSFKRAYWHYNLN